MKKMRLHIYILLGLFLVSFIVGSFVDLSLSEAIFSRNNAFGLTISSIGTLVGYSCLALCGGIVFGLALHRNYQTTVKVILYVISVGAFGCAIFFSGREFFGPNGFYNPSFKWLGYLIALPFNFATAFVGYRIARGSDNRYLLNIVIVLLVAMFLSLVPGVTLIKIIFHRPRYRTLSDPLYPEIVFHNWWERCSNYKDLMTTYNLTSEEFKSFPSGHTTASSLLILTATFAPLLDKRLTKYHLPLFYFGLVFTLLIAFSRILVGAHFLSDVSMGALLTLIFTLFANEVIIANNKKAELKEQSVNKE